MKFDEMELHELGHGVWFTWLRYAGERVGVIEWHHCPPQTGGGLIDMPDGKNLSGGALMFDIPGNAQEQRPKWQLISLDPLHIEPSVLCRTCGLHGFIRDGKWVPTP